MSFRTVYGNDWSENGWRMANRDECALPADLGLAYVDTAPIRKGAPWVILSAWLKYYDTKIAEIVSPVWGWSATNDVETSNHLSGTALDINAPQWPWGARTMPANLKARIREGLNAFEGTVFWGADWDRADEMHFQMNFEEGDARNEAFAEKLRNGYLGIYGGTAPNKGKVDDVASVWDDAVAKPSGGTEQAGILLGWNNQQIGDVLDQLAGPGTKHQRGPIKPTGWPQLGKNPDGSNRSMVDALASLMKDVAEIKAKLTPGDA